MESTFVRKDFYIQPPEKDAPADEWAEWLQKDRRKASAAKAAHTRSLEHTEIPEEYQATAQRKIGGVWKQVMNLGFSGDAEGENGCTVEPIVQGKQEQIAILRRMEMNRNVRGGTRKATEASPSKSARRHKNKKRKGKK